MVQSPAEPAPSVPFPFWPFSCLDFYRHAMRDFGRCSQALTQSTDPMQTLQAESDYGLSLWRDAMQAYWDIAVLPMTMAAKAATDAATAAQPGEAEPTAAE